MNDTAKLKSNWQTALSACNLNPRRLAKETGISHTYLYAIAAGRRLPSETIRSRLLDRFPGYTADELFGSVAPARVTPAGLLCKRCHSARTIKSGVFMGSQRYQCKDCGCVFLANQSPLHGRLPLKAVVVVLEHFLKGEPLDSIRRLIEDSEQIQISLSGLASLVSRFSRAVVELAGDILPPLSPLWVLECTTLSGERPVCILDVLDLNTGFIIASDLIPAYLEKDRETVVQKALRLTRSLPEMLVIGPELHAENLVLELDLEKMAREVSLAPHQLAVLLKFLELKAARTLLVTRRLNYAGLAGGRLLCSAWRVHYNFLSDVKPAGGCQYHSWLDIVNGTSAL